MQKLDFMENSQNILGVEPAEISVKSQNSEVKHGGAEVAGSFDPGAPEARLRLRVKVPFVAL
ncbi:MAG: hypothetical protein GY737_26660 [Desulfobacteraceae bacterium]|nr:hypothetical protein [Desulfobacteraceae bacterium]